MWHTVGDHWFVDETYVKVAGGWRYVYRAVDQHGHVIEVYVSPKRDTQAAHRFFETALGSHGEPVEVVTDRAPALRAVIEELMLGAFHNTGHSPRPARVPLTGARLVVPMVRVPESPPATVTNRRL